MTDPSDALLFLGKIGRPHGVRGEVRLFLFNPGSEALQPGMTISLHRQNVVLADDLTLEQVRYTPKFAILKFKGLEFRDQVDAFKHAELGVDPEILPELDDEEFYHRDLLDLPVFIATEEDGEDFDPDASIGQVDRLFETGANDVLVVRRRDGSELFVPVIDQAISIIDLEEQFVLLQPLELWAPEDDLTPGS